MPKTNIVGDQFIKDAARVLEYHDPTRLHSSRSIFDADKSITRENSKWSFDLAI